MKIRRLHFNQLRNNEHFQLQTELKRLVDESNPATLKIEPLYSGSYVPLYKAEDEAITKVLTNSFSELRGDGDRLRDTTFRGSAGVIRVALDHFDPEVREAARKLKIVFDTFGNVAKLPLNEETSAIYNLVQEITENHVESANKLGLLPWIMKLDADNKAYEALVTGGYEEEAAKSELRAKEVRTDVDTVVRQIIDRVEALILIEGEDNYSEFVRRLNLIFDKYGNTLAQRQGISKSKRDKEKEKESESK